MPPIHSSTPLLTSTNPQVAVTGFVAPVVKALLLQSSTMGAS